MDNYERRAQVELQSWQRKMQRAPSFTGKLTYKTQQKINSYIPEKVHKAITAAIKHMCKAVLTGAEYINPKPLEKSIPLEVREMQVRSRIDFYRKTAGVEGAITGAGGILMSFADFPLFLSIKMKLLFDIAALYGFDTKDYKERVYLLHIFQLCFSSQQHRNKTFAIMKDWEQQATHLPNDINQFDWRNFQQEYRDYIDLAKLLQMIPGIGAVIGAYVNHSMTNKLGEFAMNAYRMRVEM